MLNDPSSKSKSRWSNPRWSNYWYVLVLSLALLIFALGTHERQSDKRFALPVSVYPVQTDRILL